MILEQMFTVLLLICVAGQECTKETATMKLEGRFVNAIESQSPCEDLLLAQLE